MVCVCVCGLFFSLKIYRSGLIFLRSNIFDVEHVEHNITKGADLLTLPRL